jgi:hypothetical protein
MRRFTRLTNAFSKKLDNHIHALALYFAFYNFVRVQKTLRMSPAMAAGITDRRGSMRTPQHLSRAGLTGSARQYLKSKSPALEGRALFA